MSIRDHRLWGLVILLTSTALPLSVRSVPEVIVRPSDDVQSKAIISCLDCNPLIFGHPLNINRASVQHLISLPYIGEKRALDIVVHRTEFGDFANVEALDDVRGIGPKTVMRLRPYIVTEYVD